MDDVASLVKKLMALSNQAVEPGNIDLAHRPQVPTGGGTATVRSMSFQTPRGEVLVPTVRDDGWLMSNKQAIDNYNNTGKHLGIFPNPDAANLYAQLLHLQQQQFYGK